MGYPYAPGCENHPSLRVVFTTGYLGFQQGLMTEPHRKEANIVNRFGIEVACFLVMQSYSLDLRQRILTALAEGQTQKQVAQRFAVSLASVQRYQCLERENGIAAPKPWPGRVPRIQPDQHQDLKDLVASRTDWTLDTLAKQWQQQTGVLLSVSVLQRTLARIGCRHKKRVALPPKETRINERHSNKKSQG